MLTLYSLSSSDWMIIATVSKHNSSMFNKMFDISWLAALLSNGKKFNWIQLDAKSPKAGQLAIVWLKTCANDYIKIRKLLRLLPMLKSGSIFLEKCRTKKERETLSRQLCGCEYGPMYPFLFFSYDWVGHETQGRKRNMRFQIWVISVIIVVAK